MKKITTREQRTIWRLMPDLGGKSLKDLTPTELVRLTRVAEKWVQARERDIARLRSSAASKYYSPEELDRVEASITPFTSQVRELLDRVRTQGSK
jgi:hypothetical protein